MQSHPAGVFERRRLTNGEFADRDVRAKYMAQAVDVSRDGAPEAVCVTRPFVALLFFCGHLSPPLKLASLPIQATAVFGASSRIRRAQLSAALESPSDRPQIQTKH